MSIDTTMEYEFALREGDECTADLASILRNLNSGIVDGDDMMFEEPDF